MAITGADILFRLLSDDSGLASGLSSAEKTTTSWAGGLGKKIGPLIGGAVVGGVTVAVGALAGVGAAAFNVATDVDEATKKIQAQLGLTGDEAEKLGDVGLAVFGNNFAGSIGEAVDAVGLVRQQLGDLAEETEIQRITEDAFRLKDAFGVDVTEGLSAAQTLMENFGLSSAEAFDLLTSGFQQGLNRSDDFLDTIEEYSTQFATGGADARQFFGLLQTGLAGGALGTDKAADAFKEFRVRIQDGSDTTRDALQAIGLDADAMAAGFADGSITAAQAFDQVQSALFRTTDANVQFQSGVALLGTQFEDLGAAALGLELIPDAFEDIGGATESLNAQYATLGAAFEGFKRQFLVALAPVGDKLLEIANEAMPHVQTAFEWMGEKLPGIIDATVEFISRGVEIIKGLFSSDLAGSVLGSLGAFQIVKDWIDENMPLIRQTVQTVVDAITRFWDEHGERITRIVRTYMGILKSIFEVQLRNILDIFKLIMQLINGDLEGAGETMKGIARRTMAAFVGIVRAWVGILRTVFTEIDWPGVGRSIINGIISGIQAAGHLLVSAARGIAQGAINGMKGILGIRSPSKLAAQQIGAPIAAGILAGMESELKRLTPQLQMNLGIGPSLAAAAGASYGPTTINVFETQSAADTARQVDGVLLQRRRQGR